MDVVAAGCGPPGWPRALCPERPACLWAFERRPPVVAVGVDNAGAAVEVEVEGPNSVTVLVEAQAMMPPAVAAALATAAIFKPVRTASSLSECQWVS